jgi:hypothetical protein
MNFEERVFAAFNHRSIGEIAQLMGTNKGTLDHWLKERRDIPTVRLKQISALTGASLHWLLTGQGEANVSTENRPPVPPISAVNKKVKGDDRSINIQNTGSGDVNIETKVVKKTIVPPPLGSISESQASEIKFLLDDLGEKLTRRDGSGGYAQAHGAFKKKFDITSYKHLLEAEFEDALIYLRKRTKAVESDLRQRGLMALTRADVVRNIQTKCRKELKWRADELRDSLVSRYRKHSVEDLTMTELENFDSYLNGKIQNQKRM